METKDIVVILGIIAGIVTVGSFLAFVIYPLIYIPPEPTPASSPTPTPTLTPVLPPPVTIEITNPKEGAEVSSPLLINGTFDGELPEDWHLWMFVYNYQEWYPVNRIEPFGGKWVSKVWLNVGTRDIVVVLGDKDADSEFQRCSSEEGYLRILPQGAQVCDRITVETRESHE